MTLWKFWLWPKYYRKLKQIRAISAIYFNDTKFRLITEIIDK